MQRSTRSSPEGNPPQRMKGRTTITTAQRSELDLSNFIVGWGSDLSLESRPGVPRDKAPDIGGESLYPVIPQQSTNIRIFKSSEHGKLTPVFGTSCPPRGLSGVMRSIAFRFNEGRLSHWMLLLLADRIDVIEEILVDLSQRGRVPNVFREMGLQSEIKHNKKSLMKKALLGGLIAAGALALMQKLQSGTEKHDLSGQ